MSPNTPSDELQRRIAELERKAGQSGSLWDVATGFIPLWLVVAALVGFAGFKAAEYYFETQKVAAETDRAKFETKKTKLEAQVNNSALVREKKAELERLQEQAEKARIFANAKKEEIGDATRQMQAVEQEVRSKQEEARVAEVQAAAANKKYGYSTLQQREERAKLILTSAKAGITKAMHAKSPSEVYRVACVDNPAAEMMGCPAQYITRRLPPVGQEASQSHAAPPPAMQERVATVVSETLNLRSCPSPTCDKIVEMPQGYRAKVIGDAGNGWAQLEVTFQDGRKAKGFANAKYLQF